MHRLERERDRERERRFVGRGGRRTDQKRSCNNINVLKIGSDRSVRSIEPSTGHKTGAIQSKNRFCIEPILNRPNRRSDR